MAKAVGKAAGDIEDPLERLTVEGHLYEEDLDIFTPEMEELLTHEWIYLDVMYLEWDFLYDYLEALLEENIDPETVTQEETDAIWNTLFPDQAVEVDMTYLHAQKNLEIESG